MALFDKRSEAEKQAEKLALMEIESYKDDTYYKFRVLGPRYGLKNAGFSEGRFFNKVIKTIKKEIVRDGLTKDEILPRVHELFEEKYGERNDKVDFVVDESILNKSPEEQKEYLLKTGEYIIYKEIRHLGKMKKAGRTYTRPKGLTDVIGGAFGNTGINMETVTTGPEFSSDFVEWREFMLYLHDDKLTIPSIDKTILYEDIGSVIVDKKSQSDMGLLMQIEMSDEFYESDLQSGIKLKLPFKFRTPIALGLEAFLKDKMPKEDTPKDNASDADALVKYAELYEKGLLTEEEFNAKKKELLGL